MTLEQIAESLETNLSYEEAYDITVRDKSWLQLLLEDAYFNMAEQIDANSNNKTLVTYEAACEILDKSVLSVVMIYDEYLRRLERNLSSATP